MLPAALGPWGLHLPFLMKLKNSGQTFWPESHSWGLSYPDQDLFPWLQQGQMLEVKRASHRPSKGKTGPPRPAIRRGSSAVSVPLGFLKEVYPANYGTVTVPAAATASPLRPRKGLPGTVMPRPFLTRKESPAVQGQRDKGRLRHGAGSGPELPSGPHKGSPASSVFPYSPSSTELLGRCV